MSMTHLNIMVPEVWRAEITRIAQPLPKLIKYAPIERYLTDEVHYFAEKTIAASPKKIKLGAGFPITLGTYEKDSVTLDCYGLGTELSKIDVDRVIQGMHVNTLQREIENKTKGMIRYQDKEIVSAAMQTLAGNTVSATAAKWTTSTNIQPDVSEVIRLIEEDDCFPDVICFSPKTHELVLNSLVTGYSANVPRADIGVVKDGRVISYLGLNVEVSNNLKTVDTVLIFQSNAFGVLMQAYPLTTIPPALAPDNPFLYRAFWYAMDGMMVDRPNAIGTVTDVY